MLLFSVQTSLVLFASIIMNTRVLSFATRSSCSIRSQKPRPPSPFKALFSSTSDNDENLKHQKSYKLQGETSRNNKSGVTVRTNTGHVLQTDLPKRMGGKDEAAQPVETLLTALIGCTQATALFVGRNMRPDRLVIDRIEFDLTGFRDERGALEMPIDQTPQFPSRLREVSGTVTVYAVKNMPISDDCMELLKEQTELRCPVANMMIASGCQMNVEWIDGSTV